MENFKTQVELPYFYIGHAIGGSQDWMTDPWMKLGGCAALAAVDSCIYFTLFCKQKKLCPFDVHHLTKNLYRSFAAIMKRYLRPRYNGVSKLSLYVDGMNAYLQDRKNERLKMKMFPSGQACMEAEKALIGQLDQMMIVPFLLLNPVSEECSAYRWHWFLLAGYRWEDERLFVKAITYGAGQWLPFDRLWDTVHTDNGGMILYYFQ